MPSDSRSVSDLNPRTHTKVMRNHADSPQNPLSGSYRPFGINRGVHIMSTPTAHSTALWASQRQQAYRFGWINAVFNPTKVLLGDDPERVSDEDREREWL